MQAIAAYTDIGHNSARDILWVMNGYELETIIRGNGDNTHDKLWGVAVQDHWRGRYEYSTGFCSIAPPYGEENRKRPPTALLEILKLRFSIVQFYYFAGGVEVFSPNPRSK